MELTSVGPVVATRHIRAEGPDEVSYLVKIGLPQQFPDSADYYCPVQVLSERDNQGKVLYSAGIDAVQALQLGMKLAGGILFRLNQDCGGKLRWEGDEKGDLGFPIPS
jgi:hypothetical protein